MTCIETASSRKSGFTLIELLIVIAIIALLAAILFPVFGRVRENARRSSCQSNMKQIGIGIAQYTQDYDEILPPTTISGTGGSFAAEYLWWADDIMPYVKSTQVFICPSNISYNAPAVPTLGYVAAGGAFRMCYGAVIRRSGNSPFTEGPQTIVKLSKIDEPAATFMVGELANPARKGGYAIYTSNADDATTVVISPSTYPGNVNFNRTPYDTHFDGANWLYCDGHVKWMRTSQTSQSNDALWKVDKSGA